MTVAVAGACSASAVGIELVDLLNRASGIFRVEQQAFIQYRSSDNMAERHGGTGGKAMTNLAKRAKRVQEKVHHFVWSGHDTCQHTF